MEESEAALAIGSKAQSPSCQNRDLKLNLPARAPHNLSSDVDRRQSAGKVAVGLQSLAPSSSMQVLGLKLSLSLLGPLYCELLESA